MSLSDVFARIRSGVFHIICLDAQGKRLGSGSAFSTCGYLVANHHVYMVAKGTRVWIRREGEEDPAKGFVLDQADFSKRLLSGSDKRNFDFAVLDIPEVIKVSGVFQFPLVGKSGRRPGDRVAFAGHPLEHANLACHAGIISSLYKSGRTDVLQLDASVNPSNSGGPLFDQNDGSVIGIITRKATGLTKQFDELRKATESNIKIIEDSKKIGQMKLLGIDFTETLHANQNQMLATLNEIERQANVGIGYAFAADHLMNDNMIYRILNPSERSL